MRKSLSLLSVLLGAGCRQTCHLRKDGLQLVNRRRGRERFCERWEWVLTNLKGPESALILYHTANRPE